MNSGAKAALARARNARRIYDDMLRTCGADRETLLLADTSYEKAVFQAAYAAGDFVAFEAARRNLERLDPCFLGTRYSKLIVRFARNRLLHRAHLLWGAARREVTIALRYERLPGHGPAQRII